MIQTRPLFEIHLLVPETIDLGATPSGRRQLAITSGGEFQGARLRGSVLGAPTGDWQIQRADEVLLLDFRILLRSDDGAHIYMKCHGMRHGPAPVMAKLAAGEDVDPTLYYQRIVSTFETAAENYSWINKIVAVGNGLSEPSGARYIVEEIL